MGKRMAEAHNRVVRLNFLLRECILQGEAARPAADALFAARDKVRQQMADDKKVASVYGSLT